MCSEKHADIVSGGARKKGSAEVAPAPRTLYVERPATDERGHVSLFVAVLDGYDPLTRRLLPKLNKTLPSF